MLIFFTVGNFKVFKEKVTLDMRAASLREHQSTHLIRKEKNDYLKSALIYGKNAAGKSKLIEALAFMHDFVIDSAKDRQSNDEIETDPFRLHTETKTQPSFFEIAFLLDEVKYRYGFEVTKKVIVREWLLESKKTKEYPLFMRMDDEFQVDVKRFPEGKNKETWTRKNALFLSLVAQLNGDLAQRIIAWFDRITFAHHACDCEDDGDITRAMLENPDDRKKIVSLMKNADVDIEDLELIRFDEARSPKTGKKVVPHFEQAVVKTYHKLYGPNQEELELVDFDLLEDESDGTIRLFNLIGFLLEALDNNGILIVDELDIRLHTHLISALFQQFNRMNSQQAQWIFTTHDSNLLSSDLVRRDQVYFVEKNAFGAADMYSLATFKTRKDHNYESQYLKGRYGAIPFIDQLFQSTQNAQKENKTTR